MSMNSVIARTCDVSEEVVDQVLRTYTQFIAVHVAFNGPVATAIGTISLINGELAVIRQNADFIHLTKSEFDSIKFMDQVTRMLTNNRSGD